MRLPDISLSFSSKGIFFDMTNSSQAGTSSLADAEKHSGGVDVRLGNATQSGSGIQVQIGNSTQQGGIDVQVGNSTQQGGVDVQVGNSTRVSVQNGGVQVKFG